MYRLFLFFLLITYSYSIITIKPIEPNSKQNIGFEFGASYKKQGGNTDKFEYMLSTKMTKYNGSNLVTFLIASYQYAEVNDITNTDVTYYHLRSIYALSSTNAIELYSQLESDKFKSLESRFLLGVGDRYRLDLSSNKLYFGLGAYSSKIKESGIEVYTQTRANLYISFGGKSERLSYTLSGYAQPNISEVSDIHIIEKFQLLYDISKSIAVSMNIKFKYDSMPPSTREKYDLKNIYAITYKYNN